MSVENDFDRYMIKLIRTPKRMVTERVRISLAVPLIAVLISVLSGCGLQPEFASRPIQSKHPSRMEREMARLNMPVSVNNLWAETQNIKLNGHVKIPRVVNRNHPNYRVGRSDRFWVLNSLNDRYFISQATILCKTRHLYIYVAHGVHASRAACWHSAHTFEHTTYPTDRKVFGSEWTPGVDNDPHITLYYGPVPGVAGYFSGEDEYSRIVNRFSNQREIFFMDSSSGSLGTSAFTSTAAHEFQHMINWHVHPQNEAWSNEGASMLAQVANGFSADQVDSFYQGQPVQLDSWSNGDNTPNYGAGFLWMDYLYERFGATFIHLMLADSKHSGLQLAARMLKARENLPLSRVFGDWAVANYLNDHRLGPSFSYRNSNIHMPNTAVLGPGEIQYKANVHPYLPNYLSIKVGNASRTLRFRGGSTIGLISGSQTEPFWWSNRCDFCQTSMTRSIDLSRSHRPVLTFKAWYGIERSYDYAYVEVSTDKGVSWRTQPSDIGTNTNPNGGNFGNGITGQSWRVAHNRGGWLPVRVNLSKFQGKHILLRFQYITDDEYNGQSLAVRDIAIRAAHYIDRIGDAHWKLAGFVPTPINRIPMKWSLRLITFARHVPTVKTIPVSSSGAATIKIVGGHEKTATLVVYGQAPKTTNSSSYTLTG